MRLCLWASLLLLKQEVDEDLEEDEGDDDHVVALLQEGAALWASDGAAPQHADAPAHRKQRC